jgi:ADP-ribose pyrophosphatase YjhB (NUDIX family)
VIVSIVVSLFLYSDADRLILWVRRPRADLRVLSEWSWPEIEVAAGESLQCAAARGLREQTTIEVNPCEVRVLDLADVDPEDFDQCRAGRAVVAVEVSREVLRVDLAENEDVHFEWLVRSPFNDIANHVKGMITDGAIDDLDAIG